MNRATTRRKNAPPFMSEQQIQAYLLARDALRRARQAAATAGDAAGARHHPWQIQTRH